jgi:hypothetical protein
VNGCTYNSNIMFHRRPKVGPIHDPRIIVRFVVHAPDVICADASRSENKSTKAEQTEDMEPSRIRHIKRRNEAIRESNKKHIDEGFNDATRECVFRLAKALYILHRRPCPYCLYWP